MAQNDQGRNQGSAANRGGGSQGRGRGFAGMDEDQQRDIARKGGEASSASQRRDERGRFEGNGGSRSRSASASRSGSSSRGRSQGSSR
jgi:hypothetical protein